MILITEKNPDYLMLRIQVNKINYENANLFSKETVEIIESKKPANLAIDFTNVKYLSSIGISALSVIKGISKMNDCKIVIFGLSQEVIEILEQTGVDTLFKIVTREDQLSGCFED